MVSSSKDSHASDSDESGSQLSPPPAFELEEASCIFGELRALDRVSLTIREREQVAFIGPSGGGKTTLLNLLNSMNTPDEGRVRVFNQDLSTQSSRELQQLRTSIATIPQDLGLVTNLSVVQNVILGKGGRRGTFRSLRDTLFPSKKDVHQIHEILERVGIEEKLFARTFELSGGQQQRVAIARALFQEPNALLADEPVSSVDPARARDTVQLLVQLSKERGFTLCVSLHHLELAKEFFPRLIGLRKGTIAMDGAPADLPENELSELYRLSNAEMMQD